jgi:hypothetical protein
MVERLTGWQPDPHGIHEFRYFSMDGKPTRLVRDGEMTSHDPPPQDAPDTLVGIGTHPTNDLPNTSTWSNSQPLTEEPVRPTMEPTTIHPAANQPHGWQLDPYGLHQDRYFTRGEPTKLVRDRGVESYDEPPPGIAAFGPKPSGERHPGIAGGDETRPSNTAVFPSISPYQFGPVPTASVPTTGREPHRRAWPWVVACAPFWVRS